MWENTQPSHLINMTRHGLLKGVMQGMLFIFDITADILEVTARSYYKS